MINRLTEELGPLRRVRYVGEHSPKLCVVDEYCFPEFFSLSKVDVQVFQKLFISGHSSRRSLKTSWSPWESQEIDKT